MSADQTYDPLAEQQARAAKASPDQPPAPLVEPDLEEPPPPLVPASVEDDEEAPLFDGSTYQATGKLGAVDGHAIDKIALAFTGTVKLDPANERHVQLIAALRLGDEVALERIAAVGVVVGKAYAQELDAEGYASDVTLTCKLRLTDVQID